MVAESLPRPGERVELPFPLVLATGNPDKAREISEIFVACSTSRWSPRRSSTAATTYAFRVDRPGADRRRPRCSPRLPTSRRPARRSRRTRASRRPGSSTPSGCPRSPTTPASRSTRSAARPACTRRAYAGPRRDLRRQRRQAPARARRRRSGAAHGALRDRRARALARRARARRAGRGRRGRSRRRPRATAASATTRCSCRPKATAARLRRWRADEKHALSHRGRAFRALVAALHGPEVTTDAVAPAGQARLRPGGRDARSRCRPTSGSR